MEDIQFAWSIGILLILLVIVMIATAIWAFIFWILMIMDAAKRNMPDNDRIMWILIIVFLHAIGAAVYYFAVKRKGKPIVSTQ